jgi:hypothetical protein
VEEEQRESAGLQLIHEVSKDESEAVTPTETTATTCTTTAIVTTTSERRPSPTFATPIIGVRVPSPLAISQYDRKKSEEFLSIPKSQPVFNSSSSDSGKKKDGISCTSYITVRRLTHYSRFFPPAGSTNSGKTVINVGASTPSVASSEEASSSKSSLSEICSPKVDEDSQQSRSKVYEGEEACVSLSSKPHYAFALLESSSYSLPIPSL